MNGIFHRIEINANPDAVYSALTTKQGLSHWWTETPDARPQVDSVASFLFGEHPPIKMQVKDLQQNERVQWRCQSGPEDWLDSNICFDIQHKGNGQCTVLFHHSDWQKESEFTGHCSMKWATFLCSLKDLLETGSGRPFPNDIAV